MVKRLTIDDINVDDILTVTDVDYGFSPEIATTYHEFDGISGAIYQREKFKARKISIKYKMIGNLEQKKGLLQVILFKKGMRKIVFGDNEKVYYKGVVTGSPEFIKKTFSYAVGSFDFLCTDPFAYSIQEKQALLVNKTLVFENSGTTDVYPVFTIRAISSLKLFALSHPSGYAFQLGSENGDVFLNANDSMVIDMSRNAIFINGKRVFKPFNLSSEPICIKPGRTDLGISINNGASLPNVTATYREAYL
ncbi:phage tail family protein [Carnobacteriaceae bacterium zg-ZUI78]|nr:phage tail family protein [Carnobacteriaceae bacterium zg-ZUI78]